jgi:hypothetical protein
MVNIIVFKRSVIAAIFAVMLLTLSCRGERSPLLPNVTGRAGEVVVVINAPVWESDAGRTLGEALISEYPALPQMEPMFDVVRIGHGAFSNIFKTHRNIIIVNTSSSYSDTRMNIRHNVWAKPQIVLEINSSDVGSLNTFLGSQSGRILEELDLAERERIVEYNRQYESSSIRLHLEEKFNLSLVIPPGYTFANDTTDFAWIVFSPSAQERIQGILVYQYDYTDPETFTPEFLVERRNSFLRRFVPGSAYNSWMTTEMDFFPLFDEFMREQQYFARLRGLWKVQNDFMGGPFVSHTTLDEENNRIITVEGFVYAPADKKRNLVRQVEAIIHTLEIN